jgi:hypothetical protein
MSRTAENEHDGAPDTPRLAIERYGRVFIGVASTSHGTVHIHPQCKTLNKGVGRTIENRGGLPLKAIRQKNVCHACQEHHTTDDGALIPAGVEGGE